MDTICILFFICWQVTATPMPTPSAMPTSVPYGTPTMSMMEFSYTQVAYQQNMSLTQSANQQYIALTQQANDLAVEREKLQVAQASIRATTDAGYLNATSTAAVQTAIAYEAMMTAQFENTATAQALAVQGTQTAFALGTQAANTAVAAQSTAKAQPTTDMWTMTAIAQEVAIKQGQVDDVNLAVKRQTARNMWDAFLPWTITLGCAYVLGRGFQTWVKTRTHSRDEHGREQTFQRELPDGSVVFVKPAQLETGIVKVTNNGEVVRYAPMDKQEQSDITRRAQITDAIAVLPMPYARNAQGMMKTEFGNGMGNPSVQILNEARALSPVLEEAESKLVEE